MNNRQKLAQRGNAKAIATLINRTLQPNGITAKVRFYQGCLQITLESTHISDRHFCVTAIGNLLKNLDLDGIQRVKLVAKSTHQNAPSWTQDLLLPRRSAHPRRKKVRRANRMPNSNRPMLASKVNRRIRKKKAVRKSKPQKEPWVAVNLSFLFPGLGQIYAGKFLRGLGFIAIELLLSAIALWSFFSPSGNSLTTIGLSFPIFILYIVNLIDAHHCFKTISFLQLEKVFKNHRNKNNPWVAVFLSQLLPGLGHLYLRKFAWGGSLMVGLIIASNIARVSPGWVVMPPLIYAIACYHAYFTCPQRRKKNSSHPIVTLVCLVVAVKLMCIFVPSAIEHQYVQRFTIPSDSMIPTLRAGDRILVRKSIPYHPETGDILVFRAPEFAQTLDPNAGELFIKRVIGKPLEVVTIKDGIVYLNNLPLQEDYIAHPPDYILEPQLVPADSYFVLGDNRNDSFDSHVWGYVPKNNAIGKAYKIYWPPSRIGALE